MGSSLKNKNSQTITNSFEKFLISLKRSPNLIESDRKKKLLNTIFTDLLNTKTVIKDIVAIHT